MSENSNIEWTTHTFNGWIGCTKVSPGCAHCYAEKSTRARVLRAGGKETWGRGQPRDRTKTWHEPVKWDRKYQRQIAEWNMNALENHGVPTLPRPVRPKVFCASLSDWLDDEVPVEWLADLMVLVNQTQNLEWQLLSKRPGNWRDRINAAAVILHERGDVGAGSAGDMLVGWDQGQYPENVAIGTTIEDQPRLLMRHRDFMEIPARIHFWSSEPLLGELDVADQWKLYGKPDWVIGGGESGSEARPMHPRWARSLQRQCQEAAVPFFFKQWGDWAPGNDGPGGDLYPIDRTDIESGMFDYNDRFNGGGPNPFRQTMDRVGKKKAGRLLDGVEHNGQPAWRP